MNWTALLLNVVSGLWTRFFFGLTFQALFHLSPALFFALFFYVVYIVLLTLYNQCVRRCSQEEFLGTWCFILGVLLGLYYYPVPLQ